MSVQVRNLDFAMKLFLLKRNSKFLSRALATTYRNVIDKEEKKKTSDVFIEHKKNFATQQQQQSFHQWRNSF